MAAKYANWLGDIFRSEAGKAAVPALASVGATAGVYGIQRGIGALADARNKAKSYKEMLAMHPHLKDRDAVEVQRVFNSLHRFNPQVATDPYVAGAWVHNVIEQGSTFGPGGSGQAMIGAVKDLSAIHKNMSDSRGAKGLALHETVGKGVESTLQRMHDSKNLAAEAVSAATREERETYKFERERRHDTRQDKLDEFNHALSEQAKGQQERERDLRAKHTTLGIMEQRLRGPKDFGGGSGI